MQIIKTELYRGINFLQNKNLTHPIDNELRKKFSEKIQKYPQDYEYIKQIGTSIGLKENELYKLNSIVGPEELKQRAKSNIYSNFDTLDIISDSHYTEAQLESLAKSDFRYNLHLHTNNSDGKMSVSDLLEQAESFSEIVNKKTPEKPFIIAITDHDTVDGAKDIVKLIAKDPSKYKNLSVVLGAELSAVYRNSEMLNSPFPYEMIAYSINPFDENLNLSLEELRNQRINLSKQIVERASKLYPQAEFSYNEVCERSANPKKGIDGFLYMLADYFNKKGQARGVLVDNEDLCFKYMPTNNPNEDKISHEAGDLFKLIKDGFGFLGIAHPAKIYLGNGIIRNDFIAQCKAKGLNTGKSIIDTFVTYLKDIGNEKFNAIETNYQSYSGNLQEANEILNGKRQLNEKACGSIKWLKNFKELAKKFNLLEMGGLDTHKVNIFLKK